MMTLDIRSGDKQSYFSSPSEEHEHTYQISEQPI